ncbi:MAG: rpsI [Solirubrobacterales bacterium]|nr:rpsI [Solirubrobacterales bacterium]
MADDRTPPDEPTPAQPDEAPAPEEQVEAPAAEVPAAEEQAEAPAAEELVDDESDEDEDEDAEPAPRAKPLIPGADLEVDIVAEGADPLAREDDLSPEEAAALAEEEAAHDQPIAAVTIDLAADARYRATGKRKTAVARVTLKPGTGVYTINGRLLDEFFPRGTLQRNIRQPLEAVGYEERMDVVARLHGGGVSAQAGALRHGVSRALLEADPNLRGELKRRGFLTRDSRAKERKKAGLKKARKRPQFSKR